MNNFLDLTNRLWFARQSLCTYDVWYTCTVSIQLCVNGKAWKAHDNMQNSEIPWRRKGTNFYTFSFT
jgi:hypothetical protein